MKKVNVAKSRLSVGYTRNNQEHLKYWENNNVFKKANQSLQFLNNKQYVLLDGPPYANGQAHMGHALNKVFKDLVVKSRWFLGQSVEYRPGWDCHGLPLELAVEKQYGKLNDDELKKKCSTLAFKSLVKQRKVFKRLGVLGDWNEPYLTLSNKMRQESWATLKVLFDKNLLSYQQYPVHYCPACASSLAEAELENKLMPKDSLYFKMKLFSNKYENLYAVVWTTTPWTLPMNQALAYNETFEYELWSNEHEYLVGQNLTKLDYVNNNNFKFLRTVAVDDLKAMMCESPLTKKQVPLLVADFVEEGKTGFVHMACAHGPEDFELGQKNNLTAFTYLNKNGVFECDEFDSLNNKKYSQVAKDVCSLLQTKNLLVNFSQSQTEQQVCWRHKCGVYYNATWQVFLQLENNEFNLKEKVKALLEKSNLSQVHKEKLSNMLLGRKQWCLSRQRRWGTPMNLLVNIQTNQLSTLSSQYLDMLANQQDTSEFLKQHHDLSVFEDVLDVWFDSGNVVNEYMSRNGSQNKDYVVDLALEGKDQYRGWFQSMLWLCVAKYEMMPYGNLFSHGFVLDENRSKFAKSSGTGNVVDYYCDLYGADVLHLWVASQEPSMDSVFSEKKLDEMKTFYSRFRLSLRFLTSNLYDYNLSKHNDNLNDLKLNNSYDLYRLTLKEMLKTREQMSNYFKSYDFKKALETLYLFCEKTLSNQFFDYVKNPLYLNDEQDKLRLMTQCTCYELLDGLFDMVKVFTPFVAEEFYQDFYQNKGSVFEKYYFNDEKNQFLNSLTVNYNWQKFYSLKALLQQELEKKQQSKEVKSKLEVLCHFNLNQEYFKLLNHLKTHYSLPFLFGVSQVIFDLDVNNNNNLHLENLKLNSLYKKCPRCWNYEKYFKNDVCEQCN